MKPDHLHLRALDHWTGCAGSGPGVGVYLVDAEGMPVGASWTTYPGWAEALGDLVNFWRAYRPVPADDAYTAAPVKARIFAAHSSSVRHGVRLYRWDLDGVDPDGRYTEACWSFDSWQEALAAVPDFWRTYIAPAVERVS